MPDRREGECIRGAGPHLRIHEPSHIDPLEHSSSPVPGELRRLRAADEPVDRRRADDDRPAPLESAARNGARGLRLGLCHLPVSRRCSRRPSRRSAGPRSHRRVVGDNEPAHGSRAGAVSRLPHDHPRHSRRAPLLDGSRTGASLPHHRRQHLQLVSRVRLGISERTDERGLDAGFRRDRPSHRLAHGDRRDGASPSF